MPFDKPWQEEPAKMISDAIERMYSDDDFTRRQAFIQLDQGVEITLKTFLMLSRDYTGAVTSDEERRKAAHANFPALLDALRKAKIEDLQDDLLECIRYSHNVRNKLHHEGDGVTVTQTDAEAYAGAAVDLLHSLLGVDLCFVLNRPKVVEELKKAVESYCTVIRAVLTMKVLDFWASAAAVALDEILQKNMPYERRKDRLQEWVGSFALEMYRELWNTWAYNPHLEDTDDYFGLLATCQDSTEVFLHLLDFLDVYAPLDAYLGARAYLARAEAGEPASPDSVAEAKGLTDDLEEDCLELAEYLEQ